MGENFPFDFYVSDRSYLRFRDIAGGLDVAIWYRMESGEWVITGSFRLTPIKVKSLIKYLREKQKEMAEK
jgi:hypothetical protein